MEKSDLNGTGTAEERGSVCRAAPIIVNVHISYESAALWTVIYMLIKAGSELEEARLRHSSSCAHAGS